MLNIMHISPPTYCPYCGVLRVGTSARCHGCGADAFALPPQLSPGTSLKSGHYQVLEVLGQGGFGITYKVTSPLGGRVYAVKELFPSGMVTRAAGLSVQVSNGLDTEFERVKRRFSLEAQTLRSLRHPSATQVFENWEENGTVYLAMQYLSGPTLEQRIRSSLLSEDEARQILDILLELLEEVHGLNLLHRDIKPANIVLSPKRPELIDFGSVRNFDADSRRRVTERLLTPDYAPLELYGQEVQVGPPSDLYSLAATFYEALSGVKPTPALERAGGAPLKSLARLNPTLSPALVQALESALSLRIDQRPQSARALRERLKRTETPNTREIPVARSRVDISSRRSAVSVPLWWVLVPVGLLGGICAAIVLWPMPRLPLVQSQHPRVIPLSILASSSCKTHNIQNTKVKLPLQGAKVFLLPFDDLAYQQLRAVKPALEQRFKFKIDLLPCFAVPTDAFDASRQQYIVENLIWFAYKNKSLTRQSYTTPLIGLTSSDIYPAKTSYHFVFSQRWDQPEYNMAVISSARMNPVNFQQAPNFVLLQGRLRKMLIKNIAMTFLRMPDNTDPKSVLYSGIGSLGALDAMTENY